MLIFKITCPVDIRVCMNTEQRVLGEEQAMVHGGFETSQDSLNDCPIEKFWFMHILADLIYSKRDMVR